MKIFRLSAMAALFISGALILTINLTAKEKGPGGPPPHIQACQGKNAGDSCSFKTRNGSTRTDTCVEVKTPKGNELSCGKMPRPPKGEKMERPDNEDEE